MDTPLANLHILIVLGIACGMINVCFVLYLVGLMLVRDHGKQGVITNGKTNDGKRGP